MQSAGPPGGRPGGHPGGHPGGGGGGQVVAEQTNGSSGKPCKEFSRKGACRYGKKRAAPRPGPLDPTQPPGESD